MLIMRGSLALSHFRLERLLAKINDIVPQVNSISAEFIHFIDLEEELSKLENSVLSDLLNYGTLDFNTTTASSLSTAIPLSGSIMADTTDKRLVLVVPKPGVISFWSQKATDIAHYCHLKKIRRIERGIAYSIAANEKLTWGDEQAIAGLLHNVYTETVLYQLQDAEFLFKKCELKPIQEHKFNNEFENPNIFGYFRTYEQVSPHKNPEINLSTIHLEDAIFRLLRFPCIADKSFLITIKDRTATGCVVRDQMVGPWQVSVSDCAVLVNGFDTYQGEAIGIGERTPLAILNPAASARMAVGESITNIAGVQIRALSEVRLSVNCGRALQGFEEKAKLYDAVEAIESGLCSALGIALSASQELTDTEALPLSVIITAFAPVRDVRTILTPLLFTGDSETLLIFIDLSGGVKRLGGSALAQVFNQVGDKTPDVDNPALLKSFFTVMQQLHQEEKILAYHDRSDGGLFVTLCEMAFASHVGLQIDISELGEDPKSILFNEELGVVIQIRSEDLESVLAVLGDEMISGYVIGTLDEADQISIVFNEEIICSYARIILQKTWSETSFDLQALRDNPRCAKKQFEAVSNHADPGLNVNLTFDLRENIILPFINGGARPRIAILREEGTHGHVEMAAAFERANFECVDVQMSDLQSSMQSLAGFKALAVCGGCSFGDVLGAGLGWAKRILFNPLLRDQFEAFFMRSDTFTLGLSNGCQMLVGLKALIPGGQFWPHFTLNYSEQFESRLCLVEIQPSAAVLLHGMTGSRLLVPVAHKEGRVVFETEGFEEEIIKRGLVAVRYVDNWGRKTKTYPANPNGSPLGITGLTTPDGRVLCMMPHPDRVFRTVQHSWHPGTWGEEGPWFRMFQNAREWVE
jgi:phosphoribosylformylglycinamidine synthase